MIKWWIGLWNHEESPIHMAIVRVLVSALILWDLLEAAYLGLVQVLWSPPEVGGLPAQLLQRPVVPEVYRLFPPETSTATGLYLATCFALLFFGLGIFTRVSGLVALLLYAQLAQILPLGDRGIDLMLRDILCILIFSESGRALSMDTWRRTGRWLGDGAAVPAWPRHLMVLQLVVMYFMAGVQKTAITWTPLGHYNALYIVLQDPHIARFDFSWLERYWPLASLATMTTHIFEWTAPSVLLALHFRDTRDRPGRLRAFFNRYHVMHLWIFVGVLLHLGIAVTMNIGIFPWAMLALYPAFFHPDESKAALAWLRARRG